MQRCIGDNYNIQCPHCGKTNHSVVVGVRVVLGEIKSLSKECRHCKKTVYYHASYEIKVIAYPEDPIEALRKLS